MWWWKVRGKTRGQQSAKAVTYDRPEAASPSGDGQAIHRGCLTAAFCAVPVSLRVRRTWRFKEVDLLPRREGTSRNGWQPTADALLTM